MTEDAAAAPPGTTGNDPDTSNIAPVCDWFLRQLVGLANTFNLEQGITLTVGGSVISGQLISGKRYFEELAALVMSPMTTGDDVIKSTMAEIIRAQTAIYNKPETLPADYVFPQPGYIHLRDALWIYADGKVGPGSGGVLWRGKLSAVDGFFLGQISVTAPSVC